MGLLLMRYCAAKAEIATWPISSPDYPAPFWKPSLSAEIEFEGLDPKNPVYVTPYVTAGVNFYDGWKWSFFFAPSIKLGTDFDIGLFYRIDRVKFPERSMEFTSHIVRFNGLMTLTTKTSLSAFVQYNSAIDGVLGNIRFRYNPREGNDFYLVYDEGLNTSRKQFVPAMPISAGRTVLLKYTYTFRW